jgi:hypothetical protein
MDAKSPLHDVAAGTAAPTPGRGLGWAEQRQHGLYALSSVETALGFLRLYVGERLAWWASTGLLVALLAAWEDDYEGQVSSRRAKVYMKNRTGVGISEADRKKLFGAFTQAATRTAGLRARPWSCT